DVISSTSFCSQSLAPRALHAFPTRRSSDLPFPEVRCSTRHSRNAADAGYSRIPTFVTAGNRCQHSQFYAVGPPLPLHSSTVYRRSEEHTSELQSRLELVCRLLLEKQDRYLG